MSVLARELVASGDVYNSGYGLFPSEQARKDWQNARKKLSRAKVKKPAVVDPDLIWSLPDGEIRRYDRRMNIICRECRKSEVMQRILAFYKGNIRTLPRWTKLKSITSDMNWHFGGTWLELVWLSALYQKQTFWVSIFANELRLILIYINSYEILCNTSLNFTR